jgi:hypothetical protein
MEPPNTYTYRQSELPPMTDEIKSEIAEIGFTIANWILRFQGNYYALLALAETLADGLNSAESNMYSIRIIPDHASEEAVPPAIGLTDLPTLEKQMIISVAATSTVAIQVVSNVFGFSFDQAASYVQRITQEHYGDMTPEKIEETVAALAKSLHEKPEGEGYIVQA